MSPEFGSFQLGEVISQIMQIPVRRYWPGKTALDKRPWVQIQGPVKEFFSRKISFYVYLYDNLALQFVRYLSVKGHAVYPIMNCLSCLSSRRKSTNRFQIV